MRIVLSNSFGFGGQNALAPEKLVASVMVGEDRRRLNQSSQSVRAQHLGQVDRLLDRALAIRDQAISAAASAPRRYSARMSVWLLSRSLSRPASAPARRRRPAARARR